MEAVLMQPSPDRTASPYRETRCSRSNVLICSPAPSNSERKLVYGSAENGHKRYGPFQTCNEPNVLLNIHGSFFRYPVFPSQKPPVLPSSETFHSQKPPLLPLPVNTSLSNPQYLNVNLHLRNFRGVKDQNRHSLPPRDRGISCQPISIKCKNRDRDPNPQKVNANEVQSSEKFSNTKQAKSQKKSSATPLKPDSKQSEKDISISNAEHDLIDSLSKCLIITSTYPLGPDPSDLPKEVSGILRSVSSIIPITEGFGRVGSLQIPKEKWFGSLFSISPPPSSLPLPRFSLKQKVGCNAQAGGINAGATDNLRRLLNIN